MSYIERKTLLEIAEQQGHVTVDDIINEPAADVAPVRHGRWVKHDGYTECSECEYWYYSAESEDAGDRPNYCPNCGAKMEVHNV